MRKKVICYEDGMYLRRADGKLVGGRCDPRLMFRNGLWLTSGGRVVKPGVGEYPSIESGDLQIMDGIKVEDGLGIEEFDKRWKEAKRKWNAARKERMKTKKEPSLWDEFGIFWDAVKRKDKTKRKRGKPLKRRVV